MLKIIGSMIVIVSSTIGGIIYANTYIYRVRELNEIQRCVLQLQNEIVYTHTALPEALLNIALKSKKPISNIFKNASLALESNVYDNVYEAFKSSMCKCSELHLKQEDVNVILDLSKSLGESDVNGQVNVFLLSMNNLKKLIGDAQVAMEKNVKMYRYLGFGIGAMIVIMLI